MSISNSLKTNDSITFILPQIMNVETAEAVAAELKQLPLSENASLVLDASQVEVITTPGLQLIVSIEKTIEARGGNLAISGQRDSFINACVDSGLKSLLNHTLPNNS